MCRSRCNGISCLFACLSMVFMKISKHSIVATIVSGLPSILLKQWTLVYKCITVCRLNSSIGPGQNSALGALPTQRLAGMKM
jgi:hypothetical protein